MDRIETIVDAAFDIAIKCAFMGIAIYLVHCVLVMGGMR